MESTWQRSTTKAPFMSGTWQTARAWRRPVQNWSLSHNSGMAWSVSSHRIRRSLWRLAAMELRGFTSARMTSSFIVSWKLRSFGSGMWLLAMTVSTFLWRVAMVQRGYGRLRRRRLRGSILDIPRHWRQLLFAMILLKAYRVEIKNKIWIFFVKFIRKLRSFYCRRDVRCFSRFLGLFCLWIHWKAIFDRTFGRHIRVAGGFFVWDLRRGINCDLNSQFDGNRGCRWRAGCLLLSDLK